MSFIAGREDARPQDATISGEASQVLATFSPGHAPTRRDEAPPPPTPVAVAKPAPATSPALDETALNLGGTDRAAVEQWLSALDYDAGESAGGPFDATTRDAITDFERAIGAPATGYLTRDVLARLRHDGQAKLDAEAAAAKVPAIPAVAPMNYADELTDFGVHPQPFLQFAVATQTPLSIPGGQMITTANLVRLINDSAQRHLPVLLLDALSGAGHETLPNAVRLPFAGSGGNFNDKVQQALWSQLSTLTGNQADTPMVFFCQGAVCWESYNAALRAIYMGFHRVYWYRGGLTAWREANLPMD
jgi:PQQ-dependent catabolism-associated CXXCW motif protein